MALQPALEQFHPLVRDWFVQTFGKPTPPQSLGWPSISSGKNTLILAPTGSGKTLAAFLWAINHLVEQHLAERLSPGVRLLYVSPLKALNNDIQRNLNVPLEGIRARAAETGNRIPALRTAVRTGDTPPAQRTSMISHPPDILITTPESLYLMLTSARSRGILRTVQYVIVDEIHSIASNKRGVHLSISLERLQEIAGQEFVRIGLSATQRPLERIAAFLGGMQRKGSTVVPRPVSIIDAGGRKNMDLRVLCAAPDFSLLPGEGIWPLLLAELLELIRAHATTLVFVNSRRLAERVAASLNQLLTADARAPHSDDGPLPRGGEPFHQYAVPRPTFTTTEAMPMVQAYHGSMSRPAREAMEGDLKAGRLRALVATSSLELGIDIGSIDLVVQIQSPNGIARGIQRVGRSGHLVNVTSKGRIFPTHREDLVESTVVARAMLNNEIEPVSIPENCLDVLAQHIVAMVSTEDWSPDNAFQLIRRAYCYRDLPHNQFENVLQMLAGRFANEAFRELRPRLSWDKVNDVLRSLPGSGRIAVTSGGTIPDRGYYGVYLEDGKTKVGEIDEEFVYETRGGDTFILGTNVWRVEAIGRDRLVVKPAPGQPARMPFWRGEGISRTRGLSESLSEFRRFMSGVLDLPDCLSRLRREYPIDSRSAWNLKEYFERQRDATGVIPHDRLLLVEGFRDEIGDPRIVVHAPFGRRVNGLLGFVLLEQLSSRTGTEPQMLYNDNGVLLRSSDAESLPLELFDGLGTMDAEHIALNALLSSPLFGAQFRQNASRALLMPKTHPGKRVPLWLQRLRAGDLLEIVRNFEDFPIVIETVREILHDILDFDHFREIVAGLRQGAIEVKTLTTETPSPFSASLLLDFKTAFMYEGDQPRLRDHASGLPVSREILDQIADVESLPSGVRPDAIAHIESQLQHTAGGYRSRSPEELMELLLRIGDLSEEEIFARCEGEGRTMLRQLEADGRAIQIEVGAHSRWVAGEEKEIYEHLHDITNFRFVVTRYFRTHGPVEASEVARRFGSTTERVNGLAEELAGSRDLVRGKFTDRAAPATPGGEWCYRPTLERLHRQNLTILRREIVASPQNTFVSFLLRWHGIRSARSRNSPHLASSLMQLQGIALPAEIWERDILRTRIAEISGDQISQFTAAGNGVWVGNPPGRIRFIFRGNGALYLPDNEREPDKEPTESEARILKMLKNYGASFLGEIRTETRLSLDALNNGIARLFWRGLITNDVFTEVLSVKRPRGEEGQAIERVQLIDGRRAPDRVRMMQTVRRALRQVPGWTGRWSLVHTKGVMGEKVTPDGIAAAQAQLLLERYGILAREFHRREDLLPWPVIAAQLQIMELRGAVRRGYFVTGLSGMQYALPEAVDVLQAVQTPPGVHPDVALLHSCDPANPYGPGVDIPGTGGDNLPPHRVSRQPGNYIAFAGGSPVLIIEGYGSRLHIVGSPGEELLQTALQQFVDFLKLPERLRPFSDIVVEYCDDMRPAGSTVAPLLKRLGFIQERNQTMRRDAYT